jgi:hypothetical protein
MKINIADKSYELKERLTIADWQLLTRFDFTNEDHIPHVLSILMDMPLKFAQLVPIDLQAIAMGFVIELANSRTAITCKNFEKLTFGEFVDLDVYLNVDIVQHIADILNILVVDTEWADEALYVIENYSNYRTYVYRQYKALFELEDQDFEDTQEEIVDKMSVARNWYKVIVQLADNDITKLDEITSYPLKKVLNFMALQKEYRKEEEMERLKQKRQHDLQRNRR